jgi:enamine deaminase RidA (YjgF/YER057c/UK114 family)
MPITIKTTPAPTITRQKRPGIEMVIVQREGVRELHMTIFPVHGERPSIMLWRLDSALRAHRASVVRHEIFGALSSAPDMFRSMKLLFGEGCWPVTWVEGAPCNGSPISGMHVLAISGSPVDTIFQSGRPVGRVVTDAWARHCFLGDVRPSDISASRSNQTFSVFQQMESVLTQTGMILPDIARTWMFLDGILDWYGPFNEARTEIFTQRSLFDKLVPASTGVGVKNLGGAALVAGAWAVQPMEGPMKVREVLSPLQCPARAYGSCFSRAVEFESPGHRRLLISGTASIELGGRSARPGSVKGQINLTMTVVEAILTSCGMGYGDITRATAYFRYPKDGSLFTEWCIKHRTFMPAIITQADVCRDELLFEIELDAIAQKKRDQKSTRRQGNNHLRKDGRQETVGA